MYRTRQLLKLGAMGLLTAGLAINGALAQTNAEPNPPAAARSSAGKAVIIAIGGSQKLSMSTNKQIRMAKVDKDNVARIQGLAVEPTAVLVFGLQAGSTKLELTDIDGATEAFDVLVQLDIDAIKSVIKLTFPTANVTPIAAGTNTIVLTGNVSHPEDIEPILRVARGVLGSSGQGTTEVYNAMTVGGVRQVQLDVTIAQVNRTEARFRNFNFLINGSTISAGSVLPGLLQTGSSTSSGGLSSGPGVGLIPQAGQGIPLLSTGNAGANIIFGIVPSNINMLIQALRNENLAKLLAEPKLVTMSGHPANFLAGGRQAVLSSASGINGPGVVLEPVGTSLTFLPIVLSNGKIFLEVNPSIRNVNNAFGINTAFGFTPGFNEQSVTTRVTMEAGQTFAIGGLVQTESQASTNKVPVLGDLPYLGMFFSSISNTEIEQEMIVLVTPYLVDPMDCKQAPCKLPGTETRKPDDYELFLETIMEAPRGQRDVFQGKKYRPAWKNDSTADKIPCGGERGCGDNGCQTGNCGAGGCATGNCGGSATVTQPAIPAPPQALPK